MAEKKIYVGSGKKKSDTWLQITINPDKLADHVQEYEGNHFVKLNINIRDQPDRFGKDVAVSVDTWKPDGDNANARKPRSQPSSQANSDQDNTAQDGESSDDLPF